MVRDRAAVPAAMLMRHVTAGSSEVKQRTDGRWLNDHQSGLTHRTGLFCARASPAQ